MTMIKKVETGAILIILMFCHFICYGYFLISIDRHEFVCSSIFLLSILFIYFVMYRLIKRMSNKE